MRAIQIHVIVFFMLIIIVTSSTRTSSPHHHDRNNHHDLSIAIEEMEKANYFSFVMLINMLHTTTNSRFLSNITFLMPKDKTLSNTNITTTTNQDNSVSEFLLRHSIPSPLLFEHLNLIPNGSIVPSSLPHYNLKISNGGRSSYFLNNVKIISRNICSLGSIKCHGIDGILQSPNTIDHDDDDDESPTSNHTSPFVSCPSSHNNSHEHNGSSPDQSYGPNNNNNNNHSEHSHVSPPPYGSTSLPKSDSSKLRFGVMSGIIAMIILVLVLSVIMTGIAM
ncbi:unnamed protein product [Cochlearia groenlandica]